MRTRARAVYIVEYGQTARKGPRNRLNTQTKDIPVFPVEVSYKEPNPNLEISTEGRVKVGPKGGKLRKKRKSTRADGTNPRSKGTNPRAKRVVAL